MVADGCHRYSSHRTPASNDGQLHWGTLDSLKEYVKRSVRVTLQQKKIPKLRHSYECDPTIQLQLVL